MNTYTLPILVVFVLMAVFGLYFMSGMTHGGMPCPFSGSQLAVCATNVFTHVSHWQLAFASILVELLLLAALALAYVRRWQLSFYPEPSFQRIHKRRHEPDRPTRMQELFSRGILNRKEPSSRVI